MEMGNYYLFCFGINATCTGTVIGSKNVVTTGWRRFDAGQIVAGEKCPYVKTL